MGFKPLQTTRVEKTHYTLRPPDVGIHAWTHCGRWMDEFKQIPPPGDEDGIDPAQHCLVCIRRLRLLRKRFPRWTGVCQPCGQPFQDRGYCYIEKVCLQCCHYKLTGVPCSDLLRQVTRRFAQAKPPLILLSVTGQKPNSDVATKANQHSESCDKQKAFSTSPANLPQPEAE